MSDPMATKQMGFSRIIGVGGGGDGGYWMLGADGKLHRIPPWNPEVIRQVITALKNVPDALKTLEALELTKQR